MVIPQILEKLKACPQVRYRTEPGFLEVPPQKPGGFAVWIREGPGGHTVGYEGWHEWLSDDASAFKCFAFGLSTACRLRVFRCAGKDYRWQVLHQVNGEWTAHSAAGLFLAPFWRKREIRELQNDLLAGGCGNS